MKLGLKGAIGLCPAAFCVKSKDRRIKCLGKVVQYGETRLQANQVVGRYGAAASNISRIAEVEGVWIQSLDLFEDSLDVVEGFDGRLGPMPLPVCVLKDFPDRFEQREQTVPRAAKTGEKVALVLAGARHLHEPIARKDDSLSQQLDAVAIEE